MVLDGARAVDILLDEDELVNAVDSSINVGSKDCGADVSDPPELVLMLLELTIPDIGVDEVDTSVRSGFGSKGPGSAEGLCEAEVVDDDPRSMKLVSVEAGSVNVDSDATEVAIDGMEGVAEREVCMGLVEDITSGEVSVADDIHAGCAALCEGIIVFVTKPVVMIVVGPLVMVSVLPSRKGTMTVL